jgi:hypothetical protein
LTSTVFQLHQTKTGVGASGINGSVAALRFFFTVTLDRPEMIVADTEAMCGVAAVSLEPSSDASSENVAI